MIVSTLNSLFATWSSFVFRLRLLLTFLDRVKDDIVHCVDRRLKLVDVDLDFCEFQRSTRLLEVVLDVLLLGELPTQEAVNVFGQVSAVRLEEHRKSVLDALRMADRVHCEQERNDQTSSLVDLLHLLLHRDQCLVHLTFGELRQRRLDAVLDHVRVARIALHQLKVALRVDVRSINDQRLTVLKALRDVEVAAITHASTLALEDLNNLFFIELRA